MKHLENTGFPAGTVVLAAGMQPRFYEFILSMERLLVPAGTHWWVERSCDITSNFNDGIRRSVGDWIWFMGDDHGFDQDIVLKLLARNVDVVVPPTPIKIPPWLPCLMHGSGKLDKWKEDLPLYTWEELSSPGIMALPVGDFIGQAGMLVKRKIFEGWEYPWFRCGVNDPGRLQEDMTFCQELQQRGHTIWIDRDQVIEHYFGVGMSAKKFDGKYIPALLNGNKTLLLPDAAASRMPDGKTRAASMFPINYESATPAPESRVKWTSFGDNVDDPYWQLVTPEKKVVNE